VGDAKSVELDNGLVYTPADYQAFMNLRKSWAPKKKEEPVAAQSEAVPEGEQEGG
jgi:hypothetical protein